MKPDLHYNLFKYFQHAACLHPELSACSLEAGFHYTAPKSPSTSSQGQLGALPSAPLACCQEDAHDCPDTVQGVIAALQGQINHVSGQRLQPRAPPTSSECLGLFSACTDSA